MKTLVVLFFGTAAATFFQPILVGHRRMKHREHEDCSEEDMPGHHHSRHGNHSPGLFWRMHPSDDPPQDSPDYYKDKKKEGPDWKGQGENARDSKHWDLGHHHHHSKERPNKYPKAISKEADEIEPTEGVDSVRIRVAEKWCSRYKNKCKPRKVLSNGLTSRITGGQPAKPKEHPHMAMIGFGSDDMKQWLCGGSLISSRYVLSAAHCSRPAKWGPAKWARLGDLDISTTEEDARPQEREIVEILVHPMYKEPDVYHDIALFKMDSDVVFTAWVSPACLYTQRFITAPRATVTGWGRTDFVSNISPMLLEVDVQIFNDSYCKSNSVGSKMPGGFDALTMVCAGETAGGKDACQGDSGGPLVLKEDSCTKTQIGITSVGSMCGLPNSPGVYTRVSEYLSWIENIVWN